MVKTILHYANREREERSCLKVELAMAREWVMKAYESLSKIQGSHVSFQAKNDELRGP